MLDSIFASIFSTASGDAAITFTGLLAALLVALALGLMVALVYKLTQKSALPSQSFVLSLAILPAVIAVIILLVGSNVARAFSLAGAFAIIRFRSAPGDAKDITYVLFVSAIGLGIGMGYLAYSVVVAVLLCAAMAILEWVKFGKPTAKAKLLKITTPENLDYEGAFDSVLEKYTQSWTLNRIRTTDLGSLYELTYRVIMKEKTSNKEFIDELRCRNGNLNITLVLDAPASDGSL